VSELERAARDAVLTLLGYDSGIRACAILSPDHEVVACSADLRWSERLAAIWSAATEGGEGERKPVEVAVAGPDGELIAVRDEDGAGMTAVALVDRHALGSLVSSDLRAALRSVRGALA
jgi:hypothetical protein